MNDEKNILIVDDMEVNRFILGKTFKEEYGILEAENGKEAIKVLKEHKNSIVAVLLDIVMPEMDGYEVLELIKSKDSLRNIPVIMITGDTEVQTEYKCLNMGAYDFINKPFDPNIVKKRIENAIELYQHKNRLELLVSIQVNKLKAINDQIIDTLSTLVEFRDIESGQHIKRVRYVTEILLTCVRDKYPEYELDDKKIDMIKSASVLHDVGKITIPDSILLKPAKLTDEEYEIIQGHTCKGAQIIKNFKFVNDEAYYNCCEDICRHHHERYNGKGYPDGLSGDEISIGAQVVSIADVYDALVNERVYKRAYSKDTARKMIVRGECGVFNPKLISCFEECIDQLQKVEEKYAD